LLFAFGLITGCSYKTQLKPNVLVIVADDLGWNDVGYYGTDIRTPGIDKLAEEGIQLNRFYTAPICSPTRAVIMTGKYPNRFGQLAFSLLYHKVFPFKGCEFLY
jgi:arylsulfatase A-like enzyme